MSWNPCAHSDRQYEQVAVTASQAKASLLVPIFQPPLNPCENVWDHPSSKISGKWQIQQASFVESQKLYFRMVRNMQASTGSVKIRLPESNGKSRERVQPKKISWVWHPSASKTNADIVIAVPSLAPQHHHSSRILQIPTLGRGVRARSKRDRTRIPGAKEEQNVLGTPAW